MPESCLSSELQAGTRQVSANVRFCQAVQVVSMALCLLAVFTLHYRLELAFDRLRALDQYDVLFDADPSLRLRGFAHGWEWHNRSFIHPNLANFVNPPVRFVAKGLHMAGLAAGDPVETRRGVALLVIPLVSTLQALALWLLFRRLVDGVPEALLLTLLGVASFSQLIFGSIPDHFALSNLLLTGAFLLAFDLARQRRIRWLPWIVLGWLATGVTVTNLLAVALLFAATLHFATPRQPNVLRLTAWLVGTVAALTFFSSWLLNHGYDKQVHAKGGAVAWTQHFWRPDIVDNLLRFPTAVADAVAPTEPDAVPIGFLWPRGSHYTMRFTLQDGEAVFTRGNPLGTVFLLLLTAGAALHLRSGGWQRAVAIAALGLLGFNALMHAAWGKEYFLYSQHWLAASLVLLAGLLAGRSRRRLPLFVLLASFIALVIFNNFLNLRLIFATLEALS